MLYLVPTPIGNLGDITVRALKVLKEAEILLCEDTRRTRLLLDHHQVRNQDGRLPPLVSFHEHSGAGRLREVVGWLEEGKTVALVTDGGMPAISDPGYELVREAIRRGISFEVLPGPSAFVTAVAASGLATDAFSFFGFLPQKPGPRKKALEKLAEREETLVFYESPYRIVKVLGEMREIFGDREAVVARELTKKFEEYLRGRLSELIARMSNRKILGEFVILVSGKGRKEVFGVSEK